MDKDKNPFNLQALDSTVNISILKSQYKKLVVILLRICCGRLPRSRCPRAVNMLGLEVGSNVEGRTGIVLGLVCVTSAMLASTTDSSLSPMA